MSTLSAQQSVIKDTTAITFKKNTAVTEEETVVVFGRKSNKLNTDAAVAVIKSSDIQKYDQPSFVASFNTLPGVKMDERSPGSYRISIRGNLLRSTFGVRNTKIYLNGLPITDASGNTYFNVLSPSLIEKIQIIKGPGGSMYGAGTGGVVLMNNNNELNKKSMAAQITAGSYGTFTANVQHNHVFKKGAGSFYGSHEQSKGYREQSNMERNVAGYTISLALNKKNSITGTAFYSDLYYQTPGGLTAAQVSANPQQARPAAGIFKSAVAQKAALYIRTVYASVSDESILGQHWKNNTGIYFSYVDFKNPAIRNYEKKYEKGAGGRTVFTFEKNKITVISGVELQSGFINTSTFGNRLGIIDTLQYHDKINVNQANIFSQISIGFAKDFLFTAGLSFNKFYYGFNRIAPAETPAAANFTPQYIPRVSLRKNIPAGSVYASYSKGYSPPTIDEIHATDGKFNTQLEAEKSVNYEVGFKINALKKRLYAEITLYKTSLQNTITSRRDASSADYFINAGRTAQNGLEFSFSAYPTINNTEKKAQLKLQVAGAFVHATFKDYQRGTINYNGNILTGTAPFTGSAVADLTLPIGIYTNFTYTYTDKTALNDANTFYAKAYNLIFLRIGYKKAILTRTTLDFFAGAMHSFNKNYSLGNDLNADAARFYNPAAVNTITVGAKWTRTRS